MTLCPITHPNYGSQAKRSFQLAPGSCIVSGMHVDPNSLETPCRLVAQQHLHCEEFCLMSFKPLDSGPLTNGRNMCINMLTCNRHFYMAIPPTPWCSWRTLCRPLPILTSVSSWVHIFARLFFSPFVFYFYFLFCLLFNLFIIATHSPCSAKQAFSFLFSLLDPYIQMSLAQPIWASYDSTVVWASYSSVLCYDSPHAFLQFV